MALTKKECDQFQDDVHYIKFTNIKCLKVSCLQYQLTKTFEIYVFNSINVSELNTYLSSWNGSKKCYYCN